MKKSKRGNGAKAPAEAKRFILGKSQIFTPEVINDIHVKSELGRYRMRGLLAVQEDPALGRFDVLARHADPLRHRGLSREMRYQDGDRPARPSGR